MLCPCVLDKGTMTSEDDKLALSDCASLEESTQDKLTNLHACFPQVNAVYPLLFALVSLCYGSCSITTLPVKPS